MTLAEFLDRSGMSAAALARRCGVHPVTVAKWKAGTHVPRPAQLAMLGTVTSGRVTANDFHGTHGLAEAQASLHPETRIDLPMELLREAEEFGIDAAAVAEKALVEALSAARARRWQEENREAIEAWNKWTEENELPLAKYRMF